MSVFLVYSPEDGQLTSLSESACESQFFSKYISKMWEEDGLNFLDKMLSTSQLIKICLQKNADDEDDA